MKEFKDDDKKHISTMYPRFNYMTNGDSSLVAQRGFVCDIFWCKSYTYQFLAEYSSADLRCRINAIKSSQTFNPITATRNTL